MAQVIHQLRSSFRDRYPSSSSSLSSNSSSSSLSRMDSNNNSPAMHKKKCSSSCELCGKRLMKLAKWSNYFTLPCKCRHVFCKQCITERLHCRQKVMRSASFDLMWTFPCPASAECGQEVSVDWSRGPSYSRNMVARDLDTSTDSWDQFEDREEQLHSCLHQEEHPLHDCLHQELSCPQVSKCHHDTSALSQEIG